MCGIAGYVDFSSPPAEPILWQMVAALEHRGPDDRGVLVDGPCGLAHTRLSIIDLSGSQQPMQVAGSPVALAYNGELYNFRELRAQLQAGGVRFETRGDTEVILRSIDQAWAGALPQFDGMFGVAAWHRERRALLLARDPLGVKPVFYSVPAPHLLVFGSEIKAVLAHPAVGRSLDEAALRQVLRFRAVYGERTLYRDVHQLPPGHYLEFSATGVRTGCFYDLIEETARARAEVERLGPQETIDRGAELYRAAVQKRLVADVPVGAFLSGGLDSSLIVAAMKDLRHPDESVCTFSVGFQGDSSSELPYARTVADALGTEHTEVAVTTADYTSLIGPLTAHRDAPLSEPQDIAVAKMSALARQRVKVVLSGEGADEVFAGYPKYRFAQPPFYLRGPIRALGPGYAARLAGLLGLDRRRALIAARALSCRHEIDRAPAWFSLDRAVWAALLPGLEWSDERWADTAQDHARAFQRATAATPLGRMQTADCLTWLPGNLLERGDRMTMCVGLEMRVPFLDKQLAPYGLALPDRFKIRGKAGKWIVRRWADTRLPPNIVNRPKYGFRIPLNAWLRGPLRGLLGDYLGSRNALSRNYGEQRGLMHIIDRPIVGTADASLELWTLLATEVWYQDVFLRQRSALPGAGGPPRLLAGPMWTDRTAPASDRPNAAEPATAPAAPAARGGAAQPG